MLQLKHKEDETTRANTDSILAHLRSTTHAGVQQLADAIERDRTSFGQVVREEIAAMQAAVAQGKLSGVAMFTNELASAGTYCYITEGDCDMFEAPFALPEREDFIYLPRAQPCEESPDLPSGAGTARVADYRGQLKQIRPKGSSRDDEFGN